MSGPHVPLSPRAAPVQRGDRADPHGRRCRAAPTPTPACRHPCSTEGAPTSAASSRGPHRRLHPRRVGDPNSALLLRTSDRDPRNGYLGGGWVGGGGGGLARPGPVPDSARPKGSPLQRMVPSPRFERREEEECRLRARFGPYPGATQRRGTRIGGKRSLPTFVSPVLVSFPITTGSLRLRVRFTLAGSGNRPSVHGERTDSCYGVDMTHRTSNRPSLRARCTSTDQAVPSRRPSSYRRLSLLYWRPRGGLEGSRP